MRLPCGDPHALLRRAALRRRHLALVAVERVAEGHLSRRGFDLDEFSAVHLSLDSARPRFGVAFEAERPRLRRVAGPPDLRLPAAGRSLVKGRHRADSTAECPRIVPRSRFLRDARVLRSVTI